MWIVTFCKSIWYYTPPSDELSANESEPDGQIFLKTMCLKGGEDENTFLVKLSSTLATSDA